MNVCFVYNETDPVSANAASWLMKEHGLGESSAKSSLYLHNAKSSLLEFNADGVAASGIIFLSMHKSPSGTRSFTTHATGNWNGEASLGGRPNELSVAAPLHMLALLKGFAGIDADSEKTYEATHHGPLCNTPSLFAEFGGDDKAINNKSMANKLADAAFGAAVKIVDGDLEYRKVAMGIGGTHYPSKFNRLALEKDYAFSHIMPRHAFNAGMVGTAVKRSEPNADIAVIDWKGINSYMRETLISKLDQIGMEYERV